MIEPIAAAAASTARSVARTATTHGGTSFAAVLAKSAAKAASATATPATAKAPARPDGEQTKHVAGHPYARILNGSDKGLFINQLAGSPRQGTVFRIVERGGHSFHVYGSGKDEVVVEIKAAGAKGDATATQTGVTPAS